MNILVGKGSKDSKIDLKKVRDTAFPSDDGKTMVFQWKIFQVVLSKKLKPKQYNGIINLLYAIHYRNATSGEIESSLVMCARESHLTRDI